MTKALAARVGRWLDELCLTHPDRHVGGPGDAAACELFAREVEAAGFSVERIGFDCVDWEYAGASIDVAGERVHLHVGPYSPPFAGEAPLTPVSSVEELEALEQPGAIVLLHGDIAAEQLTPRNYPFYAMEAHARVLAALDAARPAAVIAATDRTPMAAALRPFPLFEDADLGHPSAYLLDTQGAGLLAHAGEVVRVRIDSRQVAASGEQLVARWGGGDGAAPGRVLVSAHIDSRHGTPGALDNAAGVAVLLALADLLASDGGDPRLPAVELVPFNGEDNFAAYGEMAYLGRHGEELGDVTLAINIDAVGSRGSQTAISFYSCPEALRDSVIGVAERFESVDQGPEWPMSDHMVFAMRGVPAMAITSSDLFSIAAEVAHTPKDVPELVDPALVVEAARFIRAVLSELAT